MHIANDPDPAPTAAHMWRVLREYIVVLCNAFGGPLDIARRVWISRDEARALRDVVRPLEMMLRRLVFLDALTAPVPTLAPSRARPRSPRARRESYNLDSSETWRVSFDLGMRAPRSLRHALCAAQGSADETCATSERRLPEPRAARVEGGACARLPNADFTAPLARRAEALLRGFNDPAPLVKRMARLLARDRARQYQILCDVKKRDRARPFFHEAAQTIALARDAFQAWLHDQLHRPRLADSS